MGTLIPLFRPGSVHNDSASRDDCGQAFSDELRVSSFSLKGSHIMPGQHGRPTLTSLGQVCMRHFWQNDGGLLCATALTGVGTDTK